MTLIIKYAQCASEVMVNMSPVVMLPKRALKYFVAENLQTPTLLFTSIQQINIKFISYFGYIVVFGPLLNWTVFLKIKSKPIDEFQFYVLSSNEHQLLCK